MREIKFKQPLFDRNGEFLNWHYWGWMGDGAFIGPLSMGHSVKGVKGLQYTGLKDKNDVEIYEGDIIEVRDWSLKDDKVLFYGKVEYDSGECKFDIYGSHLDSYDLFRKAKLEVIGNIYENPELLK